MPKQHPKTARPPREALGTYLVWLDSWDLSLRAVGRSDSTRYGYINDMILFAGWLRRNRPKYDDWDDVDKTCMREFFAWLQAKGSPCTHQLVDGTPAPKCPGYAVGYVRHVAVSCDQFFRWWAAEEDAVSPLTGVTLPAQQKMGQGLVEVIALEDMRRLIASVEKGKDFAARRDTALLRMYACTGARLSEIAAITFGALNLGLREAVVTGKGSKVRIVKFDDKTTLALDRYLRARAKRKGVPTGDDAPLWIGRLRNVGPPGMTSSGIYQAIKGRAKAIGIDVFPHQFRHTFSHNWLDNGGAEGDLMQLNGWDSPQMLRHYGASARSARARRAYDKIDVMGGI